MQAVLMTEQEKQESAVEPSDQHYILAFQAGDRRAFDRLVLRHQHKIFNLCFRLMGEYQEADDCAQQTFVKVYRSLKGFRFEGGFATWLYAVAVNRRHPPLYDVVSKSPFTFIPKFAGP